jgi:hypothetical protein
MLFGDAHRDLTALGTAQQRHRPRSQRAYESSGFGDQSVNAEIRP